ncbi:hypothetical protein SPI_02175 [Niveomyces insectorum RCEF 264]|uniref:Uncharacterized protein n=1 Tax=Niveomyces insectorum RCEF 264 TaxID=1081102 RepID=A0A162KAX0_9HYPO|nr:hypothetical protein SPI_02175 [Niveomyces insectorum RCEF 264]
MIVTTGPQLNGTWLTWKSFWYPDSQGPVWAYSVPNSVANQLNSAYSLMLDILTGQFWILVISTAIFLILRRKKVTHAVFKDMMPSLWNKNSDLFGAVTETTINMVTKNDNVQPSVRLWLTVLVVLALYAGQKALSILVAPKIILANAAPVDPTAIYIPSNAETGNSIVAARFVLNVPWALRALGTATAAIATLSAFVNVSQETVIGTWNGLGGPEDIKQVTYSYRVTGADMGLQRYPDLALTVNGSCFTEYSWYQGSGSLDDSPCINGDLYYWFGDPNDTFFASELAGPAPAATFVAGVPNLRGALPSSNATWAAIVSAVGKYSFTEGTDPWYRTETRSTNASTDIGAPYVVAPGRPALSCWEDNVWSYRGHRADVNSLGDLPGLDLSAGMQHVLRHYLSVPMVMEMSQYLGTSALVSGSSAIGAVIDAGANRFSTDLERLVVAAYVATTNVLTATTLYPYGASALVPNDVQSASGQVIDGVADFVVWTPEVAALNLVVVITIPVLLVAIYLCGVILLSATSLGKAKALGAVDLYFSLINAHPSAAIEFKPWNSAEWNLHHENEVPVPKPSPKAANAAEQKRIPDEPLVVNSESSMGKS